MAGELSRRDAGGELARTGPSGVAKKAAKHAVKAAAKHAAKHPTKHAPEKHAAKHAAKVAAKHAAKHAAKKAASKKAARAGGGSSLRVQGDHAVAAGDIVEAFHSLQRAGAVISLTGEETGGDLRELLSQGVELYRRASEARDGNTAGLARAAAGLLRAAEHLALAGLYAAREKHLPGVPVPSAKGTAGQIEEVSRRVERLRPPHNKARERLLAAAAELLSRARAAGPDLHLARELAVAASGLVTAVESWPSV